MIEQTALRLAEVLAVHAHHAMNGEAYNAAIEAAVELRRLHAVNQQLLEALKLMRSRFLDVNGDYGAWEQEATDAADAAIAKAQASE